MTSSRAVGYLRGFITLLVLAHHADARLSPLRAAAIHVVSRRTLLADIPRLGFRQVHERQPAGGRQRPLLHGADVLPVGPVRVAQPGTQGRRSVSRRPCATVGPAIYRLIPRRRADSVLPELSAHDVDAHAWRVHRRVALARLLAGGAGVVPLGVAGVRHRGGGTLALAPATGAYLVPARRTARGCGRSGSSRWCSRCRWWPTSRWSWRSTRSLGGRGPFTVQTGRVLHYLLYFLLGIGVGVYGLDKGLLAIDGLLARRWWVWLAGAVAAYFVAVVTSWSRQPLAGAAGAAVGFPQRPVLRPLVRDVVDGGNGRLPAFCPAVGYSRQPARQRVRHVSGALCDRDVGAVLPSCRRRGRAWPRPRRLWRHGGAQLVRDGDGPPYGAAPLDEA